MTSTDRAADLPFEGGAPRTAAHGTSGTPLPAVVPGVPELTVGPAGSDTVGPPVHHTGDDPAMAAAGHWGAALSFRRSHFVPDSHTERDQHYGRPTGLGVDGWPALLDEDGLTQGATLPRCRACLRQLGLLP